MAQQAQTLPSEWQQSKVIPGIIAKCWLNETFKTQFLNEPSRILEQEGLSVPTGVSVRVDLEASQWTTKPLSAGSEELLVSIPLPPKPADITTEDLENWLDDKGDRPRCVPFSSC